MCITSFIHIHVCAVMMYLNFMDDIFQVTNVPFQQVRLPLWLVTAAKLNIWFSSLVQSTGADTGIE